MQTQDGQAQVKEASANLSQAQALRTTPDCSRRTFLIGGTTAGLVAAATTQISTQSQASEAKRTENPIPAAAVGFWDAKNDSMKSAVSLLWGARNLIDNGVRVTIHGLGSGHPDPGIAAFSLFAHFPTQQAGVSVPFNAWNYRRDTLNHHSSPVSFNMPVHRTEGLALSVVYPQKSVAETGVESVRREHVCRFSLAAWNKQPKLRQGVYFIALPDTQSNALPDWDACRFVPEYEGEKLTGGTLWSGSKPVCFHYLILSVDPEKAS